MKSSSRTFSQTTDRPSNPIHRLSEVVPRFHSLNFSSAANQAKAEDRRGQLLEQLIKQKYEGKVAEENISFIRDSFTSFNDKIKELHKDTGVPIASKKWGKDLVVENGTNSEVDEMEDEVDDDKYGNYNSDGGTVFRRLTTQEEEEDEEHWRKTVTALPQHMTITSYYVEMGYQMAPTPRVKEIEEQNPQLPSGETSVQGKPKDKKWVPRMPNNKRPATPSPAKTNSKSNKAQLYNTEAFPNTEIIARIEASSPLSSLKPPPKRTKTASSPLSGLRFGPKPPPRFFSAENNLYCNGRWRVGRGGGTNFLNVEE
ncbi:predicted protein [Sclerotinia sclerotiorum 1980 UF-70]|uniref:Uncharacterized protein n=1 Tax=Sclerotinia sclerotiorum (strain ATCC 18683 / 1980 / Ss-1) TaxID=665079 RepID=A7F6M3_SCLS1|nr:predicted protein [Sclerotinia sclerotiorum 1980 UF-70]EDN98394.1 predicted protein [Sclerotinia sclerotiorum 1980 UF-70]